VHTLYFLLAPDPFVPGSRGDALRLRFMGADVVSMRVIGDGIPGVIATAAAARNGVGAGRLSADGNLLRWQAPGSATPGPAVACAADGVYLLEDGADASKWLRVQVYNAFLAATGEARVFIGDRYNELGPDDVAAADAIAGIIETTQYTLFNASAAPVLNVLLWIDAATAGIAVSSDGVNFYTPTSAGDPHVLSWSSIGPSGQVPLWMKRTISAAATSDPGILNELQFSWSSLNV